MAPQVLDFIPGSLEDTYKYIEIVYRYYVTAKQKVQAQIKMFDDNINLSHRNIAERTYGTRSMP